MVKQEYFHLVEEELHKIEQALNDFYAKQIEDLVATGYEDLMALSTTLDEARVAKETWEAEDTRLRNIISNDKATAEQKQKAEQDL